MLLNSKEKKLLAAVDSLAGDIHDFTARLVAQPSTLGNEQGVLELAEQYMRHLGFAPEKVDFESDSLTSHPGFAPVPWDYQGRYNLVAVKPAAGEGGRSALFNGHLDVVSAEPVEFWDTDPYSPVIKDGWMYGRGAGDMKSGVSAMLHAAAAVERAGFGLAAPLTLETVIEEECCGNGALACLLAGYNAEAALIPEPFGPTILTDQVGVLWFKVSVSGVAAHVLSTQAGANAVEKCFPLIHALRNLEVDLNAEPKPDAYKDFPHPLNLNVGIIQGGDWPSTVPAKAEFHCRLSFYPGQSFESIRKRIKDTIAQAAAGDPWLQRNQPSVEFYAFRSEGHSLPMDTPALQALGECHKDITSQKVKEYIATCTTDLRVFALYGQSQCTCYGPVSRNIHGANEAVELESILQTARAYALFLARWCGLVE